MDLISLRIDTGDSAAEAAEVARKIQEIQANQKLLDSALQGGSVTIGQYQAAHQKLAATLKSTQAEYDKVIAAASRPISLSPEGRAISGGPGRDATRNIREFGRVAQDIQYGFSAITNNIIEWAPKIGVAAVAVQVISSNAEAVAGHIAKWRDSLDSSQEGLKGNLTILEQFVSGLDLSKSRIKEAFAATAQEFGFGDVANFLRGNPDADKAKSEADSVRSDLNKILGNEAEERQKSLMTTIKGLPGGGDEFRNILTAGLSKEGQQEMLRQLGLAKDRGDAGAFGLIQDRLSRAGRPDLAFALETNLPTNQEQAKAERKRMEDGMKAQQKQREARARLAEREEAELTKMTERVEEIAARGGERGDAIVERFKRGEEEDIGRMADRMARGQVAEVLGSKPQTFGDAASYLGAIQGSGVHRTQEEVLQFTKQIAKGIEGILTKMNDAGALVVEP